jgi:hypothetical protein
VDWHFCLSNNIFIPLLNILKTSAIITRIIYRHLSKYNNYFKIDAIFIFSLKRRMWIHINITWSWLYFFITVIELSVSSSHANPDTPPPQPITYRFQFSCPTCIPLASPPHSGGGGVPAYFNNTNPVSCACRLYSTFWRSERHREYERSFMLSASELNSQPVHSTVNQFTAVEKGGGGR